MGVRVDTAGGDVSSHFDRGRGDVSGDGIPGGHYHPSGAAGVSQLHDSFMRFHGDNDSGFADVAAA